MRRCLVHCQCRGVLLIWIIVGQGPIVLAVGGGRVVRWCWVNFQRRGVLLIWIVGQGPTALTVGAGGCCSDIFTLIYPFFPLSPSLWETARYRLQYCLKGPLNPKQPTNHNKWQMSWNAAVFNKLHSIKPSLGEWQPNYRIDRKEGVTLARLRIGHTFITHSFLLKSEDWPLCIPCQEPFTVKPFLLDCTDVRLLRSRFYRVCSLKELFDTVEPVRIFSFLEEIGLYNKI